MHVQSCIPIAVRIEPMQTRPNRILFVEDGPICRSIVGQALSTAGFEVSTAAEATPALALAQKQRYDLAIVDYYLPDFPGTDFIKQLRATDEHESVPVIMLTARADELNSEYLQEALSVQVWSKARPIDELLDEVSGLIAAASSPSGSPPEAGP